MGPNPITGFYLWIMLTNTLWAIVNKLQYEGFETTFIGNIKKENYLQHLLFYYSPNKMLSKPMPMLEGVDGVSELLIVALMNVWQW